MSPPLPRGVLFDLDGVLINSLAVMRLALEAAYRDALGEPPADFEALFAEYRLHLGKGFPEIMQALGLPATLHAPFKAHSRYLARYVRPYAGVLPLVTGLRQAGWVLGIATGKDEARADELLLHLGLRPHFAVVLGCDSVPHPKPAPDMAEAFIARTGVPRERLVMVGDAPADLASARAAGCRSVAALWGFTAAALLQAEQPTHLAESPAALLHWLLACPEQAP